MSNFMKTAAAVLLSTAATMSAHAATIDQMHTATFGHYTQTFTPGGAFMILSQADYYQLSDGSTWESGAGSHPDTYSTLASTGASGAWLSYTFNLSADRILFQDTDYDSGDHSSQGVLGGQESVTLTARAGASTGTISGYTTVLSNDMTWYGEPRFNFYSAPVGTRVFFTETIQLMDTTFSANLFDGEFIYNESGVVDFTRQLSAVPESGSLALMLAGLGLLAIRRRRIATHGG